MRLLKSWFAPELNGEVAPLSQPSSWKPVDNLNESPCHRSQHAVCSNDNFIFLYGGRGPYGSLSDLWKFNIEKQSWATFEIKEGGLWPPFLEGHSLLCFDDDLIIFGGEMSLASTNEVPLWKFDLSFEKWTKVKCNGCAPVGRREHVAVSYHRNMLVHGGYVDLKGPSNEFWNFDVAKSRWNKLEPCGSVSPSARYKHSGVVFKDLFWICGGLMGVTDRNETQVWIWNLLYDHWSSVKIRGAPMQLFNHASCLIGNEVFIFGGNQKNGEASSNLWKAKITETNGKYTQMWKLCQFPDKVYPSASCNHSLIAVTSHLPPGNNFSSKITLDTHKQNNKHITMPPVSSGTPQTRITNVREHLKSNQIIDQNSVVSFPKQSNAEDSCQATSDINSSVCNNDEKLNQFHSNVTLNKNSLPLSGSHENLLLLSNSDDNTNHQNRHYYNYQGYVNTSYLESPKLTTDNAIKRFSYNLSAENVSHVKTNKKKTKYQTTSFIEISSDSILKRGLSEKSLKVLDSVSSPTVAFVKTEHNEQVLLPATFYENADILNELEVSLHESSKTADNESDQSKHLETTLLLIGGSQLHAPHLKERLHMWKCKVKVN